MGFSEPIKIAIIKRGIKSEADLARKIGWSPQNLHNKMKRDNFTESDLKSIAEALDCTYQAQFIMNDTGEIIK